MTLSQTLFRRLQTLFYASVMTACLLSCCAAQRKENSSASRSQRTATKRFAGLLNNAYPVHMQLRRSGSELSGDYAYDRSPGDTLRLRGQVGARGAVKLREFDSAGRETGVFEGSFPTTDTFVGVWYRPDGSHSIPFALRRASAGSAAQDVETLFALVSARARKLIQETLRQYTKAGDDYPYLYHVIEIAPYARRYRIEDWKPMRAERGTNGAMAGDWAEVVEKGKDSKGEWSDQGGWSLYHRIGGLWKRVAFHEGIGYDPVAFRKAHVPREIIRRLKLETME